MRNVIINLNGDEKSTLQRRTDRAYLCAKDLANYIRFSEPFDRYKAHRLADDTLIAIAACMPHGRNYPNDRVGYMADREEYEYTIANVRILLDLLEEESVSRHALAKIADRVRAYVTDWKESI